MLIFLVGFACHVSSIDFNIVYKLLLRLLRGIVFQLSLLNINMSMFIILYIYANVLRLYIKIIWSIKPWAASPGFLKQDAMFGFPPVFLTLEFDSLNLQFYNFKKPVFILLQHNFGRFKIPYDAYKFRTMHMHRETVLSA